jgi:protein-tyrosine phosphatase
MAPIETNLTDLHNHLLPEVDDGTRSLDETLRHLRALARDGVGCLAVSPHLGGWLAREPERLHRRLGRLEAKFAEVVSACAGLEDVPELRFGQEVLFTDPRPVAALLEDGRVGYRGTSYVLIEMGFHLDGDRTEVITEVHAAGRRALVAHPERYYRDGAPVTLAELIRWKEAGALLQVNGGSLVGGYGAATERLAWTLLLEGVVDVIGTDHHGDDRPVSPALVHRRLVSAGAREQADLLLAVNPGHVLRDEATVVVPSLNGARTSPAA